MMTQKPLVRPSDQWMFPDDPETATANRLGTWIASCQKAIKNSAKMAEKVSSRGMADINTFFKPTNLDSVAQMQRWHQDKLIHNVHTARNGDGKSNPPVEVHSNQSLGTSH